MSKKKKNLQNFFMLKYVTKCNETNKFYFKKCLNNLIFRKDMRAQSFLILIVKYM